MKHTLFTALLALFVMCSAGAHAQPVAATVFPPKTTLGSDCPTSLSIMAWATGDTSTKCVTGQDVMANAFNCSQDGAQLVYEGGRYICKSPGTIPTCSDDQFLSYDGASYTCKTIAANPTCSENQVLTNTENGLICVDQSVSMPTCGGGEFLTFNGTAYQCAKQQLVIPTCESGKMLAGDGNGGLTCVDMPTTAPIQSVQYGKSITNAKSATTSTAHVPPGYHMCAMTVSSLDGNGDNGNCGGCSISPKNGDGYTHGWSVSAYVCGGHGSQSSNCYARCW